MNTARRNELEDASEAIAQADWEAMEPELLDAARRCLRAVGWHEGRADRPSALEPRELVNEAVERCLTGERRWVPSAGATEESLVAFLCETMRSIASNRRTSAAVVSDAGSDALDELPDERPSASRQLSAWWLLGQIAQAIEGDREAVALHGALEEGYTQREEIAEALGWTVERVKVVRRRVTRRLASQRIQLKDHEGGPPSSAPWWKRTGSPGPGHAGRRCGARVG